MPSFCRHSRLIQNCPICAREQHLELRPVVSPGGHRATESRPARSPAGAGAGASSTRSRGAARSGGRSATGMTVRRLVREAGDGYRSELVPGIKSGADAERLAEELAFATARLAVLAADPPGLYAEVADPAGDLEERTWLAFQIAYLGPLQDPEPFASIAQARRSWASGEPPALADVTAGPRTGFVASGGERAATSPDRGLTAYRAWARRVGSQADGLRGEPGWTPERRFDRAFERLGSVARMDRDPRYDMLVTLGRLGVYELRGGMLHVGGGDHVTLAAKRILGIGDPLLLERRAADLAGACEVPIEALDLGFDNWERGSRLTMGLASETEPDQVALASARAALGLD